VLPEEERLELAAEIIASVTAAATAPTDLDALLSGVPSRPLA
jgi:hypothetical protein